MADNQNGTRQPQESSEASDSDTNGMSTSDARISPPWVPVSVQEV